MSTQKRSPTDETTDRDDANETASGNVDALFDPEKYTTTHGSVPRELDVADEEHALKQALGESEHRELQYDPRVTGERFADRYSDLSAPVREFLANAETACIRRCRFELVEQTDRTEDDITQMGVNEIVDAARAETDYSPIIEIYHSHAQSDLPELAIADNGIGISVEEFQVLQHVGMSASHDDGQVLGQYGQGVMSGFVLVGMHGEFEWVTRSRLDDTSYRERFRIDGLNDLPGIREGYGTTFTFPAFSMSVREELSIRETVEELVAGLRVPALYQEYDENNSEVFNEDYPASNLADRFEAPFTLIYEDEYVEAVTSESHTSGRDTETYLISMPIERNDGYRWGNSYSAPWYFDLRLKYEDGRVFQCNCDDADHTGKVPIDDQAFERLSDERKEKGNYIPHSELDPDNDVRMPTPVDDRDRLKSGSTAFYRVVSERLSELYKERVVDVLEIIASDGFDALYDMDTEDANQFFSGYMRYGSRSSNTEGSVIADKIEGRFAVRLGDSDAKKLNSTLTSVNYVRRTATSPETKGAQRERSVGELLVEAHGGDVYMGKSINASKANFVWALDDANVVVAVDNTNEYERYQETYGWKLLKEINLYNLEEDFPDAPSELIENYSRSYSQTPSTSSGSTSTSGTSSSGRVVRDPESRTISLRKKSSYTDTRSVSAKKVKQTLEDNGSLAGPMRSDGGPHSQLLLYRQTEQDSVSVDRKYAVGGIYRAIVPNYVADYLEGTTNVYTSVDELRAAHLNGAVETFEIGDFLEVVAPDDDTDHDDAGDDDTDTDQGTSTTSDSEPDTVIVNGYDDGGPDAVPDFVETTFGELTDRTLIVSFTDRHAEDVIERISTDDVTENTIPALLQSLVETNPVVRGLFAADKIDTLAVSGKTHLLEHYLALPNRVERNPDDVDHTLDDFDGTSMPILTETTSSYAGTIFDSTKWNLSDQDVLVHFKLPESQFPRDSPEWDLIMGGARYSIRRDRDNAHDLIETLAQLRDVVDDGAPVFVSAQREVEGQRSADS